MPRSGPLPSLLPCTVCLRAGGGALSSLRAQGRWATRDQQFQHAADTPPPPHRTQVMCTGCLCTGKQLATEHDPRIDPFSA